MKRLALFLFAFLALPIAAMAGADKPLVQVGAQTKQLPSGDTLQVNASGTGAASINIPHGSAPSSPNNGDCWTTTGGLFCRINGATVGPYSNGTGSVTTTGSPASGNLAKFSGSTSITSGDLSGDCATSGTLATTCTKTGGVSFATSATTDATNASNISSGTLNASRLPNSGASAGSYTNSNVTVDAHGLVTAISNGTGGSTGAVTKVTRLTASGVSVTTVSFSNLFSSGNTYEVRGWVQTGGTFQIGVRIGTGGTPTYQTTSYTYGYSRFSSGTGLTTASGSSILVGSSTGGTQNILFNLQDDPTVASGFPSVSGHWQDGTTFFGGVYAGVSVITGVQLVAISGTISAYDLTLYAIQR